MAEQVVIWGADQDSMAGGHWTDEILCARRKDRTFSLRARKAGDDGALVVAGKTRIRLPMAFIAAVGNLLGYEITAEDIRTEVCAAPATLDPSFASKVREAAI